MSTPCDDDQFTASLRARLNSSRLDSGLSFSELRQSLQMESEELLRSYFNGRTEIPVSFLYRYGQLVGRPVWWFFGEQPATISIESAETAIGNISRLRLYIDALESEFRQVLGQKPTEHPGRRAARPDSTVVVDFAPYLSRARAILEREAECTEDSEEVFEESVEMIAHSLYSIEMALSPSREHPPTEGP